MLATMHPHTVLFGMSMSSYVVTAGVGMFVGVALSALLAPNAGLSRCHTAIAGVAGCAAGLVGSRVWSVMFEATPRSTEWIAVDMLSRGGLSIVGGLGCGVLGVGVATRSMNVDFWRLADVGAPGTAFGVAWGRAGCLLAGCCYGSPTLFPIALVFEDYDAAARPLGVPLHATQLYELVGLIVLGSVLLTIRSRTAGARFGWLLIGYGALRIAVEPLRADWRGELLGVPATQIGALALMTVGVVLLSWLPSRLRARIPSYEPRPSTASKTR